MKTKSKIAPGHNPAQLTLAQVGRGWRLLTEAERLKRERTRGDGAPIQCWRDKRWQVGAGPGLPFHGNSPHETYRTRKPPGYFLPAKPKSPAAKGGRGEQLTPEEMIEKGAKALHESDRHAKFYSSRYSWPKSPAWHKENCLRRSRAVLNSLGLLPLKGGK